LSRTTRATNSQAWPIAARDTFKRHWRLYIFEGMELAIFMISACFATVYLFDPGFPALHLIPSAAVRRLLMGIAMGAT
jgi:hypothetical protein